MEVGSGIASIHGMGPCLCCSKCRPWQDIPENLLFIIITSLIIELSNVNLIELDKGIFSVPYFRGKKEETIKKQLYIAFSASTKSENMPMADFTDDEILTDFQKKAKEDFLNEMKRGRLTPPTSDLLDCCSVTDERKRKEWLKLQKSKKSVKHICFLSY